MDTKKKLVCHTDLVCEPDCTQGVSYKIVSDDENEIGILNNHGQTHFFDKREGHMDDYRQWFTLEEIE